MANAVLILWLGDASDAPGGAIVVAAKSDLGNLQPGLPVSAETGEGIAALKDELLKRAREILPRPGALALNRRHKTILLEVQDSLERAANAPDPLIVAEHLRRARNHLDRLTGRASVEDMLDALFGSMCIGK